jgi:hypothetical protein
MQFFGPTSQAAGPPTGSSSAQSATIRATAEALKERVKVNFMVLNRSRAT